MKGDGYPKDGGLTKKQQNFVDNGGKLTPAQTADLAEQQRKAELTKGQQKAGQIPKDTDFKGSW
jgi:hypothetical protein